MFAKQILARRGSTKDVNHGAMDASERRGMFI